MDGFVIVYRGLGQAVRYFGCAFAAASTLHAHRGCNQLVVQWYVAHNKSPVLYLAPYNTWPPTERMFHDIETKVNRRLELCDIVARNDGKIYCKHYDRAKHHRYK